MNWVLCGQCQGRVEGNAEWESLTKLPLPLQLSECLWAHPNNIRIRESSWDGEPHDRPVPNVQGTCDHWDSLLLHL